LTNNIKIISFDVEGTLVTTDFSYSIWFEAIPKRYAERHGITFEQAQKAVMAEYEKVGDQKVEWYDIRYWCQKFDLGNYEHVMEGCQSKVQYYPEVRDILSTLGTQYKLTAASGSPREFLHHLLRDIKPYFHQVFSSISDYRHIKTNDFYLKMSQALNIPPQQILHIGDNWQFDVVAARETGIHALYLDRKGQGNHQGSLTDLEQLKDYLTALKSH
jgi:HAD superfamily hydrolase (TIGR01549 family)